MIQKVITLSNNGNSHNCDYKATSKKAHTAPNIVESFVNDEGEIIHVLESGNTQSDLLYMKHWGQPKGVILPKGFKGDNPHKTRP